MKDDYLWDGSGEPDPEVQQLEEALSSLRYERKSPPPPGNVFDRMRQRYDRYYPTLAVAAAVAIAVMAGALLTRVNFNALPDASITRNSPHGSEIQAVKAISPDSQSSHSQQPFQREFAPVAAKDTDLIIRADKRDAQRRGKRLENQKNNFIRREARQEPLATALLETSMERERGIAAKENLMLALRIASSELRDVRKMVRPPAETY